MKYTIYVSLNARSEEAEAYLFYEERVEGLGEKFLVEVEKTIHSLASNPQYNTFCDTTRSIRDVALKRFPYVIIYEVFQDRIVVLSIHHTKKNR